MTDIEKAFSEIGTLVHGDYDMFVDELNQLMQTANKGGDDLILALKVAFNLGFIRAEEKANGVKIDSSVK